jgi:hypothetical protein
MGPGRVLVPAGSQKESLSIDKKGTGHGSLRVMDKRMYSTVPQ